MVLAINRDFYHHPPELYNVPIADMGRKRYPDFSDDPIAKKPLLPPAFYRELDWQVADNSFFGSHSKLTEPRISVRL